MQDNGGPVPTHALSPGSVGIDPGNSSASGGIDGRGFTRDANTDIGAFEFGAVPPPPPVTFLLSTEQDAPAPSGNIGLNAWSAGEVLEVSDVAIEPGTSEGTFGPFVNLDGFALDGDAEVDAVHIVSAPITCLLYTSPSPRDRG